MPGTVAPALALLRATRRRTQTSPLLPVELLPYRVRRRHDVALLVLVRRGRMAARRRRLRSLRDAARRTAATVHATPLAAAGQFGVDFRIEREVLSQLVLALAEFVVDASVGDGRAGGDWGGLGRRGDVPEVVVGLRQHLHLRLQIGQLVVPGWSQ